MWKDSALRHEGNSAKFGRSPIRCRDGPGSGRVAQVQTGPGWLPSLTALTLRCEPVTLRPERDAQAERLVGRDDQAVAVCPVR